MDWRHAQAPGLGGGKPSGPADRPPRRLAARGFRTAFIAFRGRRSHRPSVAARANTRRAVFSRSAAAAVLAGPR